MHKPFVWWVWIVHGLYYMLVGMFLLVSAFTIADYYRHATNPSDDFYLVIPLAVLMVIVNLFGNAIAKYHYERAQSAAPAMLLCTLVRLPRVDKENRQMDVGRSTTSRQRGSGNSLIQWQAFFPLGRYQS